MRLLGGDYTDGETTLTVTTGTGAANSDELLVVPDSGVNLIGDVEAGGGTTSLTVPDLDGDAESGNYYYAWTTRAIRPVNIVHASRHLLPSSVGEHNVIQTVEHPVKILTRRDWHELSAKHTEGATTAVWWNEAGDTDDWQAGKLHVWPEPQGATGEYLELWGQFQIDDMDSASDNFALPSRWYWAVALNLAVALSSKYGVSSEKKRWLLGLAREALYEAESGETEDYIHFQPDNRWRR